jgi:hypothetical protein
MGLFIELFWTFSGLVGLFVECTQEISGKCFESLIWIARRVHLGDINKNKSNLSKMSKKYKKLFYFHL